MSPFGQTPITEVASSGFVARPYAGSRMGLLSFAAAHRTLTSVEALWVNLPSTCAISLDVNNTALEAAVAEHGLVISMIPYTCHAAVIKAAVKGKIHVDVVTTSYVSPLCLSYMYAAAVEAGIVVTNKIGLDPDIDRLYALGVC
ncbi:hypothetical protein M378DRAFT_181610 [Amanita muscaria Koide BX008]|uniref:Saccharopine dehydrogenase NADP binding domain-containing protein n=1 Tax=Amanita muscaria (strain Koide BX008) TaxID=946122 RepID=A0A0C2WLH2_AMAMK|nr:hypothetical protein M378DRAFT_181610 [Amanita muscaria Koide BX008]